LKNTHHPKGSPASNALWEFLDGITGGCECAGTPLAFWLQIFNYAVISAQKDKQVPKDHEFGPFSLICSMGRVPGQIPHLDVMYPNFQFTMMVTENTPGTLVLPPRINNKSGMFHPLLNGLGPNPIPKSNICKITTKNCLIFWKSMEPYWMA
jgi:hypothetical protein